MLSLLIPAYTFEIEGEVYKISPCDYEGEPGATIEFPNQVQARFPLRFTSQHDFNKFVNQQIEYYVKKLDYQDEDEDEIDDN